MGKSLGKFTREDIGVNVDSSDHDITLRSGIWEVSLLMTSQKTDITSWSGTGLGGTEILISNLVWTVGAKVTFVGVLVGSRSISVSSILLCGLPT